MVRLRIVQSPDDEAVGRLLEVGTDEVIVGRSSEAGIRLADPSVSSQHVAIRAAGGGVQVRDLGSRNGVRVNGQLVAAASLGPGDEVTLGHTTLQIEEPTRPIPLPPPPAHRPGVAAAPVPPRRRAWPAVAALLGLALLAAVGLIAGRHLWMQRSSAPASPGTATATELEAARNELQQAYERYTRLITEGGRGTVEEARAAYAAALARVKALEDSPAVAGPVGATSPTAVEHASAALGPAGGAVTLPGGARIELPAGALAGTTTVTIERLPDGPGAMPWFRITAGDKPLGSPATLAVPLSEQDAREAVAIDAIHIHDERDPGSVLPVAWQPGQRTATVRLERFSIVGVLVVRGTIGLLAGTAVTGLVANTESAFQQAATAAVAAARSRSLLLRLPPFHQHGNHTMWCWASSMSAALQGQRTLEAALAAPVRPHTLAAWGQYGQGDGPSAMQWTTSSMGILAHLASLSGAEVDGRYWARYPALAAYIVQQVDAGYPVLVDIRAKTHTVVVAGYDAAGVWVLDPAVRQAPAHVPWPALYATLNSGTVAFSNNFALTTVIRLRGAGNRPPYSLNAPSCEWGESSAIDNGIVFTLGGSGTAGFRWDGSAPGGLRLVAGDPASPQPIDLLPVSPLTRLRLRRLDIGNGADAPRRLELRATLEDAATRRTAELLRHDLGELAGRTVHEVSAPDAPILATWPADLVGGRDVRLRLSLFVGGDEVDRFAVAFRMHVLRLDGVACDGRNAVATGSGFSLGAPELVVTVGPQELVTRNLRVVSDSRVDLGEPGVLAGGAGSVAFLRLPSLGLATNEITLPDLPCERPTPPQARPPSPRLDGEWTLVTRMRSGEHAGLTSRERVRIGGGAAELYFPEDGSWRYFGVLHSPKYDGDRVRAVIRQTGTGSIILELAWTGSRWEGTVTMTDRQGATEEEGAAELVP